ncbi:MAG: PepSY-associated TM helix domain-containing protein [Actinomycetota bacterium]
MNSQNPNRATQNRNAAFRWHFYAGFFVLPVLFVLASTGLVILVKPTIERLAYHEMLYVKPPTTAILLEDQKSAVEERYEFSVVDAVVPPRDERRSTQFDITDVDGRPLSVYVDPGSGEILGHIDNDTRIDFVATRIHGTLLAGKWGDYLIEIVAGWTLIMIFTGLVLWAPRSWIPGSLRRAFVPRFSARGRKPWRDSHGLVGAVGAPFLALLLVTGLPWAGFWGERVWTPFVESLDSGTNAPETDPQSDHHAADTLETAGLTITWASGMQPVPAATHSQDEPLALDSVRTLAVDVGMLPGFAIGLPVDAMGVYTLANAWPSRAQDERVVYVDQYSGKVLDETSWDRSYGMLAKATSWGVDAHMGRQLGMANAMVMGATCIGVIISCISAPIMYLKRRRKGSLALPRRPRDYRLPRWAIIVAGIICIIYPLLGLTVAFVWAIDRVLIRRVPQINHVFGGSATAEE